jgi:hypothetical protein
MMRLSSLFCSSKIAMFRLSIAISSRFRAASCFFLAVSCFFNSRFAFLAAFLSAAFCFLTAAFFADSQNKVEGWVGGKKL